MSGYKLYVLAGTGKIATAAQVVEANSDNEAVAVARAIEFRNRSELWQGSRLVATISSDGLIVRPNSGS